MLGRMMAHPTEPLLGNGLEFWFSIIRHYAAEALGERQIVNLEEASRMGSVQFRPAATPIWNKTVHIMQEWYDDRFRENTYSHGQSSR